MTLCLHPFNPQSGKRACLNKNGDTNTGAEVLTPGRPANDARIRQLDLIATGLQELEDEGVVVLFRPFHEMNGDWFWWGSTNTRQEFINLWRHIVHYMTDTKRLDNLLWVYSAGTARGKRASTPLHVLPDLAPIPWPPISTECAAMLGSPVGGEPSRSPGIQSADCRE